MVVIADFLSAVELKGNGLNLDSCAQLLPILEVMLDCGIAVEHIVITALNSTIMLCEAFGELIRQTRATATNGSVGVDISREERQRKCHMCYVSLDKIRSRLERVRQTYKKRNGSANVLGAADRAYSAIYSILS